MLHTFDKLKEKLVIKNGAKKFLDKLFVSIGAIATVLLTIFIAPIVDILDLWSSGQQADYSPFLTVAKAIAVPLIMLLYFRKFFYNEDKEHKKEVDDIKISYGTEIEELRKEYDSLYLKHKQCIEENIIVKRDMEEKIRTFEQRKQIGDLELQLKHEQEMQKLKIENAILQGAMQTKENEITNLRSIAEIQRVALDSLKTQYELRIGGNLNGKQTIT